MPQAPRRIRQRRLRQLGLPYPIQQSINSAIENDPDPLRVRIQNLPQKMLPWDDTPHPVQGPTQEEKATDVGSELFIKEIVRKMIRPNFLERMQVIQKRHGTIDAFGTDSREVTYKEAKELVLAEERKRKR